MTVRFVRTRLPAEPLGSGGPLALDVEYAWGSQRAPVAGEGVDSDGSDPEFPAGSYVVERVDWVVGLRGARRVVVRLGRA
jgi:hypothetical protein